MASRGSLFEDTLEIGLAGRRTHADPASQALSREERLSSLGVYLATQIPWQAQAHLLPSVAERPRLGRAAQSVRLWQRLLPQVDVREPECFFLFPHPVHRVPKGPFSSAPGNPSAILTVQ